ncbi:putative small protein [Desulfocurvibacter africanus PCS]|uniref:Putative small protein n=1 Tax=Desulfocurvibacter africanus PCS TaxID=1262666 RepID=M5PSR8_DESAF|nr:DUF1127 domain-containing protein [Desulfocurvibacter africanus]EMG37412.1 putative small protein [Desulfocurvibacter africanus PCS]
MDTPSDPLAQRHWQIGNGLLDLSTRMVRALVKWYRRRRLLQELMALDEHLLKDIGFRRDEVLKALRSGGLPTRIDWMSDKMPLATQRRGARCPTSDALAVGRPCSM